MKVFAERLAWESTTGAPNKGMRVSRPRASVGLGRMGVRLGFFGESYMFRWNVYYSPGNMKCSAGMYDIS